ncbi:hypothetical protein [Vibrio barjaei]|uniref:hypothetical protein n=1 Tax=Vibrio barjaei TaxID=1676683 RepID=UPI002284E0F7|nr:hypothetical protein [Vibrio barjaei]MCY9874072.1 hypothetical protein [Vibrio barjaei]
MQNKLIKNSHLNTKKLNNKWVIETELCTISIEGSVTPNQLEIYINTLNRYFLEGTANGARKANNKLLPLLKGINHNIQKKYVSTLAIDRENIKMSCINNKWTVKLGKEILGTFSSDWTKREIIKLINDCNDIYDLGTNSGFIQKQLEFKNILSGQSN